VATFKNVSEYRNTQNFFHACVKLYQVNNNFSYSDFLFLYGIITYLINKNAIEEDDFIARLRTLRNLIWNSNSGEIRGDADFMKDLLCGVKTLMLKGYIDKELTHKFNGIQIDEENEKKEKVHESDIEILHKYEDHPLIYGYASGLGYDNLKLVDTFLSLFSGTTEFVKIHCALLAIGDYRQNNSNRYYMGNHNRATWSQLLHKSRNRDNFEKTMKVLCTLLQQIKDGKDLDAIINGYISECEKAQKYDWRYYFVKYPNMLRGADGELKWDEPNGYLCTTLNKHQFNGQHWNSFLNVIYQNLSSELNKDGKKIIDLANYGENLNILNPISSLAATATGFIYYYQDSNELWNIEQEDAIDKIDIIAFAINEIKNLVQEN
jgi:hypothetical protein